MQHTPPTTPQTLPSPSPVGDATPTPQTPLKKRSLESCAAEFVEKGWKLVEEIHPKQDHPFGTVKEQRVGETEGK